TETKTIIRTETKIRNPTKINKDRINNLRIKIVVSKTLDRIGMDKTPIKTAVAKISSGKTVRIQTNTATAGIIHRAILIPTKTVTQVTHHDKYFFGLRNGFFVFVSRL
ncbi:MAG: hypothetical protein ACKO96_30270, partial [Flammeovirgaceae bacterium]